MTGRDDERCANCWYWRFISQDSPAYARGACERHAPTPADEEHNKGLKDYAGTWWPETDSDDWCGEYRRAPETVMLGRPTRPVYSTDEWPAPGG